MRAVIHSNRLGKRVQRVGKSTMYSHIIAMICAKKSLPEHGSAIQNELKRAEKPPRYPQICAKSFDLREYRLPGMWVQWDIWLDLENELSGSKTPLDVLKFLLKAMTCLTVYYAPRKEKNEQFIARAITKCGLANFTPVEHIPTIIHHTRAENTTLAFLSWERKWHFRPGYYEINI